LVQIKATDKNGPKVVYNITGTTDSSMRSAVELIDYVLDMWKDCGVISYEELLSVDEINSLKAIPQVPDSIV